MLTNSARRLQTFPSPQDASAPRGRRAPPLSAVEAFVVAARCSNFRTAAELLSLSPSALTRRIQGLEAYVGEPLFLRSANGVRLTPRGLEYLTDVESPLRSIRCAAYGRTRPDRAGPLRIALSHSLARNWLISRLPALIADTGVDVELRTSRDAHVLRDGRADVAIWGGLHSADDLLSTVLFSAEAVAVGSADDSATDCTFDVDRIAGHRLLSVGSPQGMWQRWLHLQRCHRASQVVEFETLQLVYEAACAGLGLALAIPLVSEPHLRQRRLRAVCSARQPLHESYRLYFSDGATRDARVNRVSEWLRDAVACSCHEFDAWWREQGQALANGSDRTKRRMAPATATRS